MNTDRKIILLIAACVGTISLQAQQPKEASTITQSSNKTWYDKLDFKDSTDWKDATRGFIATVDSGIIRNDKGQVVVNSALYNFLKGEAPATVNPALWRHSKIDAISGLFKVTEGIYQFRGLDLANLTFIRSKNGFIAIDPLTNKAAARAALALLQKKVADLPVVAVITTHSHSDHYGGIAGIVSAEDLASGKIPYITPKDFYEESVSEGVLLGNAMRRRATYQFGFGLPFNDKGAIDQGIGKGFYRAAASANLWRPTLEIDSTGYAKVIDGVKIIFHYTPNSEAPAELNFFLPDFKVYFSGELATHSLHNLLPARGTRVRDAKAWGHYLDEAIDLFGSNIEYLVPSHTWPVFGHRESIQYLQKQRDLYLFIHNQTIFLANKGLNADEIAETIQLPKSIASEWHTQNFYGTVQHNSKAVYQYYLGWYDGNPANYNKLPQQEEAKRYVEWFGGEAAAIEKAKAAYDKGDYRWVAEALKWVVFANPANTIAKNLQADAFEQLGYQAESAIWRNLYLTGAKELREGVTRFELNNQTAFLNDLTAEGIFDFLSIAVDGNRLEKTDAAVRFIFTDTKKDILVFAQNGVLHHKPYGKEQPVALTLQIPQKKFVALLQNPETAPQILLSEDVKHEGELLTLRSLFGGIEKHDPFWNIITP